MRPDDVHNFLMEAHRISQESQFIVDSLPNAKQPAVEWVLHQLGAIRTILTNLDDPHSAPETIIALEAYVNGLIQPLAHFLANPPPPARSHIPLNTTGRRGHPSYQLDLDRALLLHDLGNTWEDITWAMGVSLQTLYNHMDNAGRSTARREWTEISDDELDERVAEISLLHPFYFYSVEFMQLVILHCFSSECWRRPSGRWSAGIHSPFIRPD
ncbi:hypothetical protein B0H19DRAFT_1270940 [Mycena capillaripes]|nr:hypothetical protein B0H19DRAFT_1270940 [Mycena capillaripes]